MENNENTTGTTTDNKLEDSMHKEEPTKNSLKEKTDLKKWLYSFILKNKNGEELKFFILKPPRSLRQNGEIQYAKQLANFVKAGLLPKAAWSTILENLGGTVSESDAENYNNARKSFFENSIELNKINQKSDLSEEDHTKIAKLKENLLASQSAMQTFELEQIYIFENTAEAKARNATIQWWLSQLSYKNETENFFHGETFDEKMDWYDDLDPDNEDDAFLIKVAQKFNYLITMWFLNRANSWDDFDSINVSFTDDK
jgi:hypothetical protein